LKSIVLPAFIGVDLRLKSLFLSNLCLPVPWQIGFEPSYFVSSNPNPQMAQSVHPRNLASFRPISASETNRSRLRTLSRIRATTAKMTFRPPPFEMNPLPDYPFGARIPHEELCKNSL
jgi:hypothetical protein